MPQPITQLSTPAGLRRDAESRLSNGTTPATRGWPTGIEALRLLHGLAGMPDSASDALKLLHELQVHQVELDLQHEQAEIQRQELAESLARMELLFDGAPFAYLALVPSGLIVLGNLAAAAWLGVTREALEGCLLASLLAETSRASLQALFARLAEDGKPAGALLRADDDDGAARPVLASTTQDGRLVLLAAMPVAP